MNAATHSQDERAALAARLAIVGPGEAAQFAAEHFLGQGHVVATGTADDLNRLLASPEIAAIFLDGSTADPVAMLTRIFEAETAAVVCTPFAAAAEAMQPLLNQFGDRLHLFLPGRADVNFRSALYSMRSGVCGRLRHVRREHWTAALESSEPNAPTVSPRLIAAVDQILALVDEPAIELACDWRPHETLLRLTFPGGTLGRIVLRTNSTLRLEDGWAIDGDRGGWHAGKQWIRTADDEIYSRADEALPPVEVPADLELCLATAIAGQPPAVSADHALRLLDLCDRLQRLCDGSRPDDVA